ncbi:MAG: hypothetical protein HC767_12405, partial [Akkermansiaceae bacterium]|nr:hypothetical protein [Akkermansiaceae bacterium]
EQIEQREAGRKSLRDVAEMTGGKSLKDLLSPLGMAEVTLTMADCEGPLKVDFNEVALTRRVFRDGRSEYRINGTLCRLKDIHDLLMDTGIGRTAYSIMAQGQIDQILSSKPEERRAVFEEAAGITKI